MIEQKINSGLLQFAVVGGQRCGTGWLAQCLREHPEISMAKDESRYFIEKYTLGDEWFQSKFESDEPDGVIRGEKCAEYLTSNIALDRLAKLEPEIRIVICVRHPIERYKSARLMKNRMSKGQLSLEVLDEDDFERGLFGKYCGEYLNRFDSKNVLIVSYDELTEKPEACIQGIYRFLEVEDNFIPKSSRLRTKPGALENKHPIIAKASFLFLHRLSPLKKLYTWIRNHVSENRSLSAFDMMLLELYTNDILELDKLTKLNVKSWIKSRK